jgi:hypothetical protein
MKRITQRKMLAEWGERCDDFDAECPACMAWSAWDLSKPRAESQLDETVDLIIKRNPDFMAELDAIIKQGG